MPINVCRVCHHGLFAKALLRYEGMPKSAQFFPDATNVQDDQGETLDVCQCSGCGLVQLNNAPVSYYREVIRAASVSAEMTKFRLDQFEQWVKKYALSGKKVIEIGCGAGEFMRIMQVNNVELYGLEQGRESVIRCREDGLDIENGFIEYKTQELQNAPFDAFYMLNFLEHLPDPNTTLKGLSHNLVEGAIGLIEVPNFDMIIRNNLFSEFISDHLLYFTKETFVSTLHRNGFDVLECNEVWQDYSISAVIQKRGKTDLARFSLMQSRLKMELSEYIAQYPSDSVAIWGAGHQALAVMSLTELKGKVKYVIDSAEFKQNKYTPATHIPIVSPNKIKENPVKAVIVMAASYSDEVITILSERYAEVHISVLRADGLEVVK